MGKIKYKESYELKSSIAPQTFFMDGSQIYYFDKINKYEGRFCVKDNNEERIISETGDGYGIYDNEGNMYLINLNMLSNKTQYSEKNRFVADHEMDGIFFDFKADDYGNYLFLGNVDGKTVIKIMDKDYNVKRRIEPKEIVFGSSMHIYGEDMFLGAVGKKDEFKIIRLNYIGSTVDSYNIKVQSKNRIISKIDICGELLTALITGKKESVIVYNIITDSLKEILPVEFGLKSISDISINNGVLYVLSERKVLGFEIEELIDKKPLPAPLVCRLDIDRGMCIRLMYLDELFCCTKKYFRASVCTAFFQFAFLYILNIVNPSGILDIAEMIAGFIFVFCYLTGSFSMFYNLGIKHNRIEKLLCVMGGKGSFSSVYISSLLNMTAVFAGIYLVAAFYGWNYMYFLFLAGVFVFVTAINMLSKRHLPNIQNDVIVQLLEDDDIQLKSYIKKLSEGMNKSRSSELKVNITSYKEIDKNIAELWQKSRSIILKNKIECTVNENKMTAVIDLSLRDIKYSKYNIIMDFICFVRLNTRIKDLKIEILDTKYI